MERKWARELDYRLRKELWTAHENRIAVHFEYECHDRTGQWFRSYGVELWEFAPDGRMRRRVSSINDQKISEAERRLALSAPAVPTICAFAICALRAG